MRSAGGIRFRFCVLHQTVGAPLFRGSWCLVFQLPRKGGFDSCGWHVSWDLNSLLRWRYGTGSVTYHSTDGFRSHKPKGKSQEHHAQLFSTASARTGALRLVLVRARRGCSGTKVLFCSPFAYGSSVGTQYRASPTLIQRPTFSSTMNCITASEPHRGHLPCSLSVPTSEQSRHSNSSVG